MLMGISESIGCKSLYRGQYITVCTKLGKVISECKVVNVNNYGVITDKGFFSKSLHVFSLKKIDEKNENECIIDEHPDSRVARKLSMQNENNSKDNNDNNQSRDDVDNPAIAKPKTSIDIKQLPDDIKKSIMSTMQLNAQQLDGVLYDIGDAVIKALRRENVKDGAIHDAVSQIQDAVYEILTSKKKET